ncbi:MAG: ABC transporter ATP-binding protein [Bacillota bacterium]|nr:ABC transporter ATP-binding protein [Bacillota bacterium]
MLDIRKEFPGVVACDDIDFKVKKGEIHALLGENGAGKSTLMNILFGLYQPDHGSIRLRGDKVNITNPNIANNLGIGMVHQHFKLVHNFTVTENIILGLEPTRLMMIDTRRASARIRELSERYGLNVEPDAKIEDVSVGMQQRVEILKMLYRDAEVLIFDEPTAVLTPQEVGELMKIMRGLIDEGKTIILITHKLKEIMKIADRCTVIRWGKVVGTVDVEDTTEEKLAEMMVGRKVLFELDKKAANPREEILRIENLTVSGSSGAHGLKNFSLSVRCGEIVGLAGVDGNGQTELIEAIIGLRRVDSGKIFIHGLDVTDMSTRERINAGMAHIPEDRHKHGLILEYTVQENFILKNYFKEPFSKKGLLDWDYVYEHANRVINDFDVRSGQGAEALARSLSGGNQQKAILGREIDGNPEILVAVQPTRGLDVGAIEYIHQRLLEQRDQGKAVFMISLELDEILDLSDRIAVIYNGELVGIVDAAQTDENEIGLMMVGGKRGAVA